LYKFDLYKGIFQAIEVKLPQGEEPRFPEDEGMFIGTRPEVSSKLQNKLENRFDLFLSNCPVISMILILLQDSA